MRHCSVRTLPFANIAAHTCMTTSTTEVFSLLFQNSILLFQRIHQTYAQPCRTQHQVSVIGACLQFCNLQLLQSGNPCTLVSQREADAASAARAKVEAELDVANKALAAEKQTVSGGSLPLAGELQQLQPDASAQICVFRLLMCSFLRALTTHSPSVQ